MISPAQQLFAEHGSAQGLVNLGSLIERALEAKSQKEMFQKLLRSRYEVRGLWQTRFADLLKMTGTLDVADYEYKVRRDINFCQPVYYQFREVPVRFHRNIKGLRMEMNGHSYGGPTASEMLVMLTEHAVSVRFLLSYYPRILFFGDTGNFTESFVGVLAFKDGQFRLERELIASMSVAVGQRYLVFTRSANQQPA